MLSKSEADDFCPVIKPKGRKFLPKKRKREPKEMETLEGKPRKAIWLKLVECGLYTDSDTPSIPSEIEYEERDSGMINIDVAKPNPLAPKQ